VDSHLLVTPAIFKPGSMVFKNQRKSKKRGFPIKTFGNDGGEGFLNGSTRNLNNGRRHLYGSKKKKHGCLIKDFRHDERGVIPEWFYQQSGTIRAKSTYRLLFFVAAMTLLICHPGSTRNLNYLRAKAFGFPIKTFGNDGGGGRHP